MFSSLRSSGIKRPRGTNITTFFTILLIILMAYGAKFMMPAKSSAGVYPEKFTYKGIEYRFTEIVEGSPISFVRKAGGSDQGNIILAARKDKREKQPEKLYIYIGGRRYRMYIMLESYK